MGVSETERNSTKMTSPKNQLIIKCEQCQHVIYQGIINDEALQIYTCPECKSSFLSKIVHSES